MKNLNLIIIALLIGSYSCKAQPQLNQLTYSEYYNIKIDGVSFQSIYDTNGEEVEMKALFGNDLLYEYKNDILISKGFWKPSLYSFSFESPEGNYFTPLSISIWDSSITVTVKGINVKLGDSKSIFGNTIMFHENTNSFIFSSYTGTSSLAFKIDENTNKVIAIEFNSF